MPAERLSILSPPLVMSPAAAPTLAPVPTVMLLSGSLISSVLNHSMAYSASAGAVTEISIAPLPSRLVGSQNLSAEIDSTWIVGSTNSSTIVNTAESNLHAVVLLIILAL